MNWNKIADGKDKNLPPLNIPVLIKGIALAKVYNMGIEHVSMDKAIAMRKECIFMDCGYTWIGTDRNNFNPKDVEFWALLD